MAEMGVAGRTDSGACRPSLEIPEGEDPDLLQSLLDSTAVGPLASLSFHVETPGPREAGAVGIATRRMLGLSALSGAPRRHLARGINVGASRRDPLC